MTSNGNFWVYPCFFPLKFNLNSNNAVIFTYKVRRIICTARVCRLSRLNVSVELSGSECARSGSYAARAPGGGSLVCSAAFAHFRCSGDSVLTSLPSRFGEKYLIFPSRFRLTSLQIKSYRNSQVVYCRVTHKTLALRR